MCINRVIACHRCQMEGIMKTIGGKCRKICSLNGVDLRSLILIYMLNDASCRWDIITSYYAIIQDLTLQSVRTS